MCVPPRPHFPLGVSLMQVEYRAKHRKEGSHGLSMLGRPDIEMAKKAAKLSSQVIQNGIQGPRCGSFKTSQGQAIPRKSSVNEPRDTGS